MSERRFRDLEQALTRAGVAVWHARRATLEMEGHFQQLVEDALARGETSQEARRIAHEALGEDHELISHFAARRELLNWTHRWPAGYALAPLATFVGLAVTEMAILVVLTNGISGYLHRLSLSASVTADINLLMNALFLWMLPLGVAVGFAIHAHRRRIALRWPLAGILILCMVAAMINLHVVITGGPHPGYANAGISAGLRQLPAQLVRALGKAALALIPLAWMALRLRSKRPAT